MIPMRLGEIAVILDGTVGGAAGATDAAAADVEVTGPAAADSRSVEPGGLFLAIAGDRVDGHDFVGAAMAGGAAAALVSRPVPAPHVLVADPVAAAGRLTRAVVDRLVVAGLTVVGVTGSSGKTGTKDLLAQLLAPLGPTVAPAESYNTDVGVAVTALRADKATRHLVVEMGARGIGHIAALTALTPPRVGVVLNVGAAHAGEFGSREATAAAKSELVAALPYAHDGGLAVLNADDQLVAAMATATAARVLTFGLGAGADVRAEQVRLDADGRARFGLRIGDRDPVDVRLGVVGAHQVGNALAAAAVAVELGATPESVAAGLAAAGPVSRWRMEVTGRADGLTVVNDAYNANPDSVRAALEAVVAMAGGRRVWAVLGEMLELGAASTTEHEQVGRLARRLDVDRVVAVGEGARPVLAGALASGAVEGEEAWLVADVPAAVTLLRSRLASTDVVLVKGSRAAGLERVAAALLGEPS